MLYVINEHFECKRSSRASDVVCEQAVRCYWFERVKITDQDHVTMNPQGCRNMHQCKMHLSIINPKLKEILASSRCLSFDKNGF